MRLTLAWILVAAVGFPRIRGQTLQSELLGLISSFLGDPTVIADLAPIETNPALVSTLEAYIEYIQDNTMGAIPTAPPAFITAFPTAAQNDFTRIFAEDDSIISANGGLTANGFVPLPISSVPGLNVTSTNSTRSAHPSTTGTSRPQTTSRSTLVTGRPTSVTATASSAASTTATATGGGSQMARMSTVRNGLLTCIAAFFWL